MSAAEPKVRPERQRHYRVICISMYEKDLAELDVKVGVLKGRGFTRANRSALIRYALSLVDAHSKLIPREPF